MVRKKKDKEVYIPKEVYIKVRIEPAFKIIIESDSTDKKWNGHTWYGNTAIDVLRKVRNSLHIGVYKEDNVHFTSSTPELIPAISWKEPILNNDPNR
jgi:hypothetical protein